MSLAAPGTNPASNLELKLPHTIGSANQLLKVDGNGQLGWADDNSGLSISNNADNRIVTGTGSALNAEANLTFDGSTLNLTGRLEADTITGPAGSAGNFSIASGHANTPFIFYVGQYGVSATEKLRISSGGKLTVTSNSEPQVDVQATSAAGASMRVQSAGAYAYYMAVSTNIHWRWGMPTGTSDWVLRESTNNRDRFWVDTGNGAYFKGVSHTNLEIRSNSSSTKALIQTVQDSDVRIGASTNHPLALYAGGLEKARIDTSGRLCIGQASSINGGILCIGTGQGSNPVGGEGFKLAPSANTITFLDSSSNSSDIGDIQLWNTVYNNCSAKIQLYHPASNTGGIKFYTHDGTSLKERINVTNDGKYHFGHTNNNAGSNGRLYVTSVSGQCTADLHHSVNDNQNVLNVIHGGVGGNGNPTRVMVEWRNFNNNAIATIQSNSSTVTYGTGSDYRMKENEVAISDGITRIKQLKPYRFNWKSDYGGGDKVDGFFAHEAATVVPESVLGDKDAVDSDGNIIRQQIDQAKLVPLLTAALKEAITKIETLETKVAALEAG